MKKYAGWLDLLNRSWFGAFVAGILMFAILCFGFGQVFLHPNGYLFARDGDGLKNYFNLGYYLKNDVGLHFSGVNYPYGEHLLYTDSHPILAYFLNFIDNHILEIAPNSVAIINLSILGGMVLCPIIIYLVFRHYNIQGWYAIVIALSITLLSPQWSRIHGHLSLSYSFIIPLFYLVLLKIKSHPRHKIRYLWLLIFLLLIGGIHLYYVAICAVFILFFLGISWIQSYPRSSSKKFIPYLYWFFVLLTPLAFYSLLPALTDFVDDRPANPYGFYAYHATWGSVFMPYTGALKEFLERLFSPHITWEGRSYIGSNSLFFIFALMFICAWSYFRDKQLNRWLEPFDQKVLLSSLFVLLFSMCIPFEWGLQIIPETIKPLKQFRALGRFSWVFFYAINIVGAVYLYRWTTENASRMWSIIIVALVSSLWLLDGGQFYINHGPVNIYTNDKLENNSQEYLERFLSSGQSIEDFQAVFPLPLAAIRTDKMSRDRDLSAYNEGIKCSWHTGLPLLQSTASRPSFEHSFSSIQMIAGPSIKKDRLLDLNEKPLLLVFSKGSLLDEEETRLLGASSLFWEDNFIELRRLPMSAFRFLLPKQLEGKQFKHEPTNETISCFPDCDQVRWESFDNHKASQALAGSGARYSDDSFTLIESPKLESIDSIIYELTFWVYIDPSYSGMPRYRLSWLDRDGKEQSSGPVDISHNTEIDRGWVRVNVPTLPSSPFQVELIGEKITVDNLLIRPKSTDVQVNLDTGVLYNNYWLE